MNIATHSVEVPFPQAFASLRRSPFPSAPRYGTLWLAREDNRPLGVYSAPFGIIRSSLLVVLQSYSLTPTQKWKWRMSLYIFMHPWLESAGLSKKDFVMTPMLL
jgi:hypothetical protein